MTLINYALRLDTDDFTWIRNYTNNITNSLRYLIKKNNYINEASIKKLLIFSKGDTHGVPVSEILERCIKSDSVNIIALLFQYLSDKGVKELIALLKYESFIQKTGLSKSKASEILNQYGKIKSDMISPIESVGLFSHKPSSPNDSTTTNSNSMTANMI